MMSLEYALNAAVSGVRARQTEMDVLAHNMSNVSTTAFKCSEVECVEQTTAPVRSAGVETSPGINAPVGTQVGLGTTIQAATKHFSQGPIEASDNQYHLAINGDGFLEVEKDGKPFYTRDGRLKLNKDGEWSTSMGYKLKSNFQAVPAGSQITISETGDVTAFSEAGTTTFKIQLTRFLNPSGLTPVGQLYAINEGSSGPAETGDPGANGFGSIVHRALEGSNANYIDLMVKMIKVHRAHESSVNTINQTDKMLASESNLVQR